MTTAIFPASLDPTHIGHVDLINYAVAHDIGDSGRLIVVLSNNPDKGSGLFDKDIRRRLLELSLDKAVSPFIQIVDADGVSNEERLRLYKPDKIIRGIRKYDEAEYELSWAHELRLAHREMLGPNCRFIYHDCPLELEGVDSTSARDAIIGKNGKDIADLHKLMAAPVANLFVAVLTGHPEAREKRTLLNKLIREALDERQNAKLATPETWDAIAAECYKRTPCLEGESKQIWKVDQETLGAYGAHHAESVCIVRLKPTVYSYTNQRDGIIPGTEKLRLRATEVMWGWLKESGIDVPAHHVGHDYYVIDAVKAPPIEVVVKAAHVGTPKHKLYGTHQYETRTGEIIAANEAHIPYVRFDWRNPKNHPETGQALADECIPTELADRYIDTRIAAQTARKSFECLHSNLAARGVELQDICFFIARNGFSLFSEVSPDGLRAKWLGHDLDKDDFRKGNNASSVIDAYALLVGITENGPSFYTPTDKQTIIERTKMKYGIESVRPAAKGTLPQKRSEAAL